MYFAIDMKLGRWLDYKVLILVFYSLTQILVSMVTYILIPLLYIGKILDHAMVEKLDLSSRKFADGYLVKWGLCISFIFLFGVEFCFLWLLKVDIIIFGKCQNETNISVFSLQCIKWNMHKHWWGTLYCFAVLQYPLVSGNSDFMIKHC